MSRAAAIFPSLLGLFVAATAAAAPPASTGAGPVSERTRALIAAFMAVQPLPDTGGTPLTPEQRKANEAAFAKLDGFFAYDRLLEDLIGPHRQSFDTAQLERYRSSFRALVRLIAYPGSGGFFRDAVWELKAPQGKGEVVSIELHAKLPKQDLETTVTFHWKEMAGAWRIVDVWFDGSSLVKDYQNQFGRILGKEGVAGLQKRIDDRLAEEQKASAGLLP